MSVGCFSQTQVIFLIVNMHETAWSHAWPVPLYKHLFILLPDPWMFMEYLQPLNKTQKVSILGGQKVTSIFLCTPAGKLIERRVLRLKQLQDKPRQLSSLKASWLI